MASITFCFNASTKSVVPLRRRGGSNWEPFLGHSLLTGLWGGTPVSFKVLKSSTGYCTSSSSSTVSIDSYDVAHQEYVVTAFSVSFAGVIMVLVINHSLDEQFSATDGT